MRCRSIKRRASSFPAENWKWEGTVDSGFGGVAQWLGLRSLASAWRTFPDAPDLWFTFEHFMGKPTRPTQPSIPSGSVNEK